MADFESTVQNILSTTLTTENHRWLHDKTIELRNTPADPQFNIKGTTVALLSEFFADADRNAVSRRWVGVFLLELVTVCEVQRELFRKGPARLTLAFGEIITRPESDELKIIAGSIIRILHTHGFALNSFWPNDVAGEANESFSQRQDTQWVTDLYNFLDQLREIGKSVDSESQVVMALDIAIEGPQLCKHSGGVLIEVQSGMLTCVALPLARGPLFLDLAMSSVEHTRIKHIDTTSQTALAQGIDLYLKSDSWNLIVNGKQQRSKLISLAFSTEEDARDLASIIKREREKTAADSHDTSGISPLAPSCGVTGGQSALKPQSTHSKLSAVNLELSTNKATVRRMTDFELDGSPPRKLRDRLRDEKGKVPLKAEETSPTRGHATRQQGKQQLGKSQSRKKELAEASSNPKTIPVIKKIKAAAQKNDKLSGGEGDENNSHAAEAMKVSDIFDIHDTDRSPATRKKVPAKASRKPKSTAPKRKTGGRRKQKARPADDDSETYVPGAKAAKAKKRTPRETKATVAKKKGVSVDETQSNDKERGDSQEAEDVAAEQHFDLEEPSSINNQLPETAATSSPVHAPLNAHHKTIAHSETILPSEQTDASDEVTMDAESHLHPRVTGMSSNPLMLYQENLLVDQAVKFPSLIEFGNSGPVNQGTVSKETLVQLSQRHADNLPRSPSRVDQPLEADTAKSNPGDYHVNQVTIEDPQHNPTSALPLPHLTSQARLGALEGDMNQEQYQAEPAVMASLLQGLNGVKGTSQARNGTRAHETIARPKLPHTGSDTNKSMNVHRKDIGDNSPLAAIDEGLPASDFLELDRQPLIGRPVVKPDRQSAVAPLLLVENDAVNSVEERASERHVNALQPPVPSRVTPNAENFPLAQLPQVSLDREPEQAYRHLSSNRDQPHTTVQIPSKRPMTESPPITPRAKRTKELHTVQDQDNEVGTYEPSHSNQSSVVGGEGPTGSQLSNRVDSHGSPYPKDTQLQLDQYTAERVAQPRRSHVGFLESDFPTTGADTQRSQAGSGRLKLRSTSNAVSHQQTKKPHSPRPNKTLSLGASAYQVSTVGTTEPSAAIHRTVSSKQIKSPVSKKIVRVVTRSVEIAKQIEEPVVEAARAAEEDELPAGVTRFRNILQARARSIPVTEVTVSTNTKATAWGDGDETLVGEAPNQGSDPMELDEGQRAAEHEQEEDGAVDEEVYSSDSEISRSSNAEETEPTTEESQETAVEEEVAWEDTLLPHQRTYADAVIRISHRLLRHVVDREKAITSVLEDYETNSLILIDKMAEIHQKEHDKSIAKLEEVKRLLVVELEGQCKTLERDQKEMRAAAGKVGKADRAGKRGYQDRMNEIDGLMVEYA